MKTRVLLAALLALAVTVTVTVTVPAHPRESPSTRRGRIPRQRVEARAAAADGKTSVGPSAGAIVKTYAWHGLRHILCGYDHLLFLGALVLAAATLWDLVKIVTAFTMVIPSRSRWRR
jgi:HupE/UreJ protein